MDEDYGVSEEELIEHYGRPPFYDSKEMYAMTHITNTEIMSGLQEIRIVLLGVPDSEDMGLYGQVKDMVKLQGELNGSVRNQDRRITILETIIAKPVNLSKKQAAGITGTVFILGGFLAGVVNAIGNAIELW